MNTMRPGLAPAQVPERESKSHETVASTGLDRAFHGLKWAISALGTACAVRPPLIGFFSGENVQSVSVFRPGEEGIPMFSEG
jgi:hypothetical protein